MQQTLELENPGSSWVALVSPEDDIGSSANDIGFSGKEKKLGDLGIGQLYAHNQYPHYLDHELGFAFIDGKLITDKARVLGQHDRYPLLYELHVYIWPFGQIWAPMPCQLLLPDNTILEQGLYMDEDQLDSDYRTRYEMTPAGHSWKRLDEPIGKEYRFFVPADTSFLSALKFSFKSSWGIPILVKPAS